jgi:hypothetical protein
MDEQIRESDKKDATGDFVFFIMETFKQELKKKETDKIKEIIVTVILEGKLDLSKADTFINQFQNLESIKFIKGKITSVINIPKKELNEVLKHDLWLNSDKCLKYGLVDEIWKN